MECKLRCINIRTVSDRRRAMWPAVVVTGISDDWYRSPMGVIVISWGTPRSAGENFGSDDDMPGSADDKPGSAGERSASTSKHSRAVWEIHLL